MAGENTDGPAGRRPERERLPATLYAAGFSFRKRRFVRSFLCGSEVRFIRDARRVAPDAALLLWGSRPPPPGHTGPVVRVEDGFLRSVGLGAAFAPPLSWVIDGRGIYYDATRPSELEHLLQTMTFDAGLLARAGRLRAALVASGITKYNLGAPPWQRPPGTGGRTVILVPGQVESDASIRCGAPGICTNLGLLQAVRVANPGAYVVYKPHPDVLAGLRAGGQGEADALAWCDEQVTAAPMDQLLAEMDEVHVLTSLAGFEALLRGKAVTCYGQPFYAGWGLTTDVIPPARRTRRVPLDALVAAALIVYPTYISRETGGFTTPERVIEELRQWRGETARIPPAGWLRRASDRMFNAVLKWWNDPRPPSGHR